LATVQRPRIRSKTTGIPKEARTFWQWEAELHLEKAKECYSRANRWMMTARWQYETQRWREE